MSYSQCTQSEWRTFLQRGGFAHPVNKEVRVVCEKGEYALLVLEVVRQQEGRGGLGSAKNLASLHLNSSRQRDRRQRPRKGALTQGKMSAARSRCLCTMGDCPLGDLREQRAMLARLHANELHARGIPDAPLCLNSGSCGP